MALLTTTALTVAIGNQPICHSLSLEINTGERWALLGRNGAGKSTLLHTLAGLRPAVSGEIALQGEAIEMLTLQQRAQRLGLLFQQQDDAFPSTVLETTLIGRHPYLKPWQWESQSDYDKALTALQQLQLETFAERITTTLSGGERQRLAIATLLTQEPALMLLDEPTNHLDIHHQIALLNLLQQWSQQGERALLMTLHDINLALRYCDHAILLLGDGEVVMGRSEEVLTTANLERLYLHPLRRIEGEWGQAYLPR
jgi:iron complex transport system ATP-binding protein